MIHAYGPFNKLRMVCINFSLTIIQFSHTRSACNRYIRLICSRFTLIFVVVAVFAISKHYIFHFSIIHAYEPFNKLRMVCINFSLTIIQFSHTRIICSRHIRLICSDLTLIFVVVVAFTIS